MTLEPFVQQVVADYYILSHCFTKVKIMVMSTPRFFNLAKWVERWYY